MRPRLIAVDDRGGNREGVDHGIDASMRPRLIAVDDPLPVRSRAAPRIGFNEATADRRG